ncbi:MAG: diaminopimelate epimerase, partial [Pyrinomonadaceae bacterium]
MRRIPFVKYQGYGNDYIVLESQQVGDVGSISAIVRGICDRHYGVGGDGVALISRTSVKGTHFNVRIFNADGSEAAMSGNGTRCAAAHLYQSELWTEPVLRLDTKAGAKTYRLLGREEGHFKFEAEIGRPQFQSEKIPFRSPVSLERVIDFPLELSDEEVVRVTALQMCNPNCILFVDDFNHLNWRRLGREIEKHSLFPERTNVEFVRVIDRGRVESRVWER